MTAAERVLFQRIQRRAAMTEPDLALAILKAFQRIRDQFTEAQLTRLVELGYGDRFFDLVLTQAVQDVAFQPVRERLRYALVQAVPYYAREIPKPPTPNTLAVSFDFLNPRVLDAVRALETRVITSLQATIRATVKQVVERGLRDGLGPRAFAVELRSVVGLAPNQLQEIQNYRDALNGVNGRSVTDYTLRDKRFTKLPTTPEQVDKLVAAYTKRRIAQQAETVARTAALDAQKIGQRESWADAVSKGIVDGSRLRHQWIGVDDSRERPEHVAMNNQSQSWDVPYSNGQIYPGAGDYGCRCLDKFYLL